MSKRTSIQARKPTILIDTNMLILLGEGINIFEQIEEKLLTKPKYIIVKPVLEELEKIARRSSPGMRKKIDLAIKIAENTCEILDLEHKPGEKVDDILLQVAEKLGAAVATNDKYLRKRLRRAGIPEIYLREESMRIEVEGLEF